MHDSAKKQLAELTPEVQAFAKNKTEYLWKIKYLFDSETLTSSAAGEITLGLIDEFNALSGDAKDYFQKAFPASVAFLTSKETVKRLQER
ncbi:unnamed protein product [Cylicostephanus goldi]|uniref:Uncharacterized protein n=1 Tax=Cylicostephanus goldi TaxID=71465 RepID=A0A3P7MR53_CYLGO|nr:unnamed protein product [Cylicostephanus goldi]